MTSEPTLAGYVDLADILARRNPKDKQFFEVAQLLEAATSKELVSERLGGLTRLYCSLCYAISGEYQFKQVIQGIRKRQVSLLPINELLSPYLSESLFKLLVDFCDERYRATATASGDLIDYVGKILKDPQLSPLYIKASHPDEVDRFLDLLILTNQSSQWLAGDDVKGHSPKESSKWLIELVDDFEKKFDDSEVEPWMLLVSLLQASLVRSQVDDRSLHSFFHRYDLDCHRFRTITNAYPIFYPSQTEFADEIVQGRDVLVSSPTGTGKTVLGLLTIASKAGQSGLSIYATPTRALAYQVTNRLRKLVFDNEPDAVRVFTREDTVTEEMLAKCRVLVGTYEKIDGITRQKLFDKSQVPLVIVDECHTVSNPNRGITLDFFLTKSRAAIPTQRLLLSAVIPEGDRDAFAGWAGVISRQFPWRRTRLDVWVEHLGKRMKPEELLKMNLPAFSVRGARSKREKESSDPVIVRAIDAFRQEKMALIIVDIRATTEKLAHQIAAILNEKAYETLTQDRDLQRIFEKRSKEISESIQRLDRMELVPPALISEISQLLMRGVAFHHAGLPRQVKVEIETLIEKRLLGVVVATTTLEMGVDFPVDIVLIKRLFQTKTINEIRRAIARGPVDRTVMNFVYSRYLDEYFSAYSNIEGRAARAQFAEQGEAIFYADGSDDLRTFRDMYFKERRLGGGGDIYLVEKLVEEKLPRTVRFASDESRGRFLSVLLSLIDAYGGEVDRVLRIVEQSWLWTKLEKMDFLGPHRIVKGVGLVNAEVDFLKRMGLIYSNQNLNQLTRLGQHVNVSLVSPTSVVKMLHFLQSAKLDRLSQEDLEFAMLYCISLSYELHTGPMRKVPLEYETKLSAVTPEPLDSRSLFVALILKLWSSGVPTVDIIRGLKLKSSDYGFIEHDIPENAVWLLQFLLSIFSDKSFSVTDGLMKTSRLLVEKLKFGSDNPAAMTLISLRLPSVGRSSALAISAKFKLKHLEAMKGVTQGEFVKAFPGREDIALQVHSDIIASLGPRPTTG